MREISVNLEIAKSTGYAPRGPNARVVAGALAFHGLTERNTQPTV